MKILLTADLHGSRTWYEWLAGAAPEFDLIAIAGDLVTGIGAVGDQNMVTFVIGQVTFENMQPFVDFPQPTRSC